MYSEYAPTGFKQTVIILTCFGKILGTFGCQVISQSVHSFYSMKFLTIPGFPGLLLKNPGQNDAIFLMKCCLLDPCGLDLEGKISI